MSAFRRAVPQTDDHVGVDPRVSLLFYGEVPGERDHPDLFLDRGLLVLLVLRPWKPGVTSLKAPMAVRLAASRLSSPATA